MNHHQRALRWNVGYTIPPNKDVSNCDFRAAERAVKRKKVERINKPRKTDDKEALVVNTSTTDDLDTVTNKKNILGRIHKERRIYTALGGNAYSIRKGKS